MPKTTSLIYRASKLTPTYFECVNVHMPSRVQPRTGCTSYHVPNTNIVYIFGGTYDCVANLMAYQTDISLFNVDTLTLETVPKVFYFAFSHESQLVS